MWAICGVSHLAGYAVFSACDGGDDDYHDSWRDLGCVGPSWRAGLAETAKVVTS
jgi:hypothetical protein